MPRTKLYFRMLGYIKPYLLLLGVAVVLSLFVVAFESVSLWLIGTLANSLFNPHAADAIAIPGFSLTNLNKTLKAYVYLLVQAPTPVQTLSRVCVIFIVAFSLKNIFSFIHSLLLSLLNLNVVRDLRNQLYAHVLMLPVTFYDRNRSGNIMSNILTDVGQLNTAMVNTFNKLATEPIRLLTFISILFIINWKMTILVFLIYPFLALIIVKIGHSVRRRSRRMLESMAGLISVLQETLTGIRAVKMFNMNEAETGKFKKENQRFTRISYRSTRIGSLSSPLTEIFGLLIAVSLLWYGGSLVLAGKGMTAEDFIRYLTILIFSYQPIKSLGGVNNSIQGGLAAAERVFGIMDTRIEKLIPFAEKSAPVFDRQIEFSHVCFTYPGTTEQVLHDCSFTIKKGQVVALIGASGSGKSTILDLLPRFYEIDSGSITIDGKDIRECDLVGLRHIFGIVAQETILFNDSVYNNIAYGIANTTREKVIEAARAANAGEFIEKLPKGLDTDIGEKGVLLSGGQCQRLAIARALLRNPPILILDEATSSLDTESERLVQTAINILMQRRTALVVAHRLSTIRHADLILVIDKGRIIERGTHDELIAISNSKYRYFYDMQFTSPEKAGDQ
jgi:subfamily B ATP-binding cassette protein MsbA